MINPWNGQTGGTEITATLKTGEAVNVSLPVEVEECGCCGHYHLKPLTGNPYLDDCRFDGNRYDWNELNLVFGEDGWLDVT